MQTLDFNAGFAPVKQSVNESQQVNEFLGAALVAGALGFLAIKGTLNIFAQIQAARAEIMKSKHERASSKQELNKIKAENREQKEMKKLAKKNEKAMKKNLKMTYAWENSILSMPDGPEKDKMMAQMDCQRKLLQGRATADDFKQLEEASKKAPKGAEELEDKVNKATDEINDDMMTKWLKSKGIDPDPEKLAQSFSKSAETIEKEQPEQKTEDEIKKEITDKYSQETDEKNIPDELKTDNKYDQKKVDELTGDSLTQVAGKAGIETTKPKQEPATQGAQGTPEQTQGTQGTPEPQKPDEEWVDDDGTKYTKIGDKYTMTTKDGKSTELSKDDYENHIENDDVKDAERTDNDDDIEDLDYSNKEDLAKDPHKKYKQRTYKRGSKTFKTKSYYDKKGNSISKDDFNKMYQAWQEKQSKGKKKTTQDNNSLFSFTRLIDIKKTPANMNEAKMATDREGICKERLVYIKYVMDTTDNGVEKVKMERMYNALYNITFNTNGELRTLDDLYTYINETMTENKGTIPGLPTNDQIENIDKKVKAFKELHEDKFKAYLNRFEKENLDKAKTEKKDVAKDLLSEKQPKNDTDAMSEIKKISSIPGLTNILGLEPERKMSSDDVDKQKEVERQNKEGSPNAKQPSEKDVEPDDISDDDIAKIVNGDVKGM